MNIAQKNIMNRIGKMEAEQKAIGERIRLVYTDGHTEETRESFPVRVEEVGASMKWYAYVEGYSKSLPELQRVEYLDTGEVWDFEEEARKPPMTDEEVQAIKREVEEAIRKNEGRYNR